MPSLSLPGKPFIFLLDSREREKAHARGYTDNPEALDEYGAIVEALFQIVESRTVTKPEIGVLRDAVQSRHRVVYREAVRRLMQLSHYSEDASDALFELLGHSKATIRIRVIQGIWSDRPPIEITRMLVEIGKKDVSAKVRSFAEDREASYVHGLSPMEWYRKKKGEPGATDNPGGA